MDNQEEMSVAEFRANLREAFNRAEAGKLVVIRRHDTNFMLVTTHQWNDQMADAQRTGMTRLVTDGVSSNIRPDIQKPFEVKPGNSQVVDNRKDIKSILGMDIKIDPNLKDGEFKVHKENIGGVDVPVIQTITPAEHYKDDIVPIPSAMQDENIDYCEHDLPPRACRHPECPNYSPKCCTLKTPCKHWAFDERNQQWLNSITGEVREVES